jgi:predicted GH43/DUF377 family glycosyl hydrolase
MAIQIQQTTDSLVHRLSDRPTIEAGSVPGYGPIFNAGVLHHEGRYHLFARAVQDGYKPGEDGGPRFTNYVSDIIVFTSVNGLNYEFGYVLVRGGAVSFEDPRVQRVAGDEREDIVITYTHVPPPGTGPWRIGAQRLLWNAEQFHLDETSARLLGPHGIEDKDGVIFALNDGRVALIHRIHPDMQLAVFDDLDHFWDADEDYWNDYMSDLASHTLLTPSPGSLGVGAGAPPVHTSAGFLLFFHERWADGTYTMNVALLDDSTGEVLSRLPAAVLSPEMVWECHGDVNKVVFVQGAHLDGDDIYLTYGAADRCVGAAVASVPRLLEALLGCSQNPKVFGDSVNNSPSKRA